MKFLIFSLLLTFSFSAMGRGNYASKSEILKKIADPDYVLRAGKYKKGYLNIDKFNAKYSKVEKEVIDDRSKPITEIVDCPITPVDITPTFPVDITATSPVDLTETSPSQPEEVCTEIIGYEQMFSGRDVVMHDNDKKTDYDLIETVKKQTRVTRRKGRGKRAKCIAMLEFITGANTGLDIISVDAMIYKFKDIYEALDKPCRLPKAIVEIRKVVDPEYQGMRQALLMIAEGE